MGCGSSVEEYVPSAYSNRGQMPPQTGIYGERSLMTTAGARVDPVSREAEIDKATLEEYMNLERQIHEAEKLSPLSTLEIKNQRMRQLTTDLEHMEATYKQLEEKTSKEKADVDQLENEDTKAILTQKGSHKDRMSKEQQEYLDATNRQEIAKKELDNVKEEKEHLEKEIKELNEKAENLQVLYQRQDDLLDKIFCGEYGSETENRLENELDELELKRAQILEANFKWRQAQMMMEYACKQLAVAVQKWQNLPEVPALNLEIRYTMAEETRNNLISAGQNMQGAHQYLDGVNFPYCNPDEVDTLTKGQATSYVFTDMQTPDRHKHAEECYSTTHKRAAALLQWFDQVINKTILKDLNDVSQEVKQKTLALRRERVSLIKNKIESVWGHPVDFDMDSGIYDEDTGMMYDLSRNQVYGGDGLAGYSGTIPSVDPNDLAPIPSNEEIFGKIDEVAKEHQRQLEEFMKEQEQNQARVNKSLEAKLMARRQRRARMNLEDMEKSQLVQG